MEPVLVGVLAALLVSVIHADPYNRGPYGVSRFRQPEIRGRFDLTQIKWAHAVNSKQELQDALLSDIDMLEADVLIGKLLTWPDAGLTAIMAHPPAVSSDLSLDQFLDAAFAQSTKGIKLDFKIPQVIPVALEKIAQRITQAIRIPIWLNADILKGPVDAADPIVNAADFLQQCKAIPSAVLSVGWTTRFGPDIRNPFNVIKNGSYSRDDVLRMRDILIDNQVTQQVTFPVRAGIAASEESHRNLIWLLNEVPYSTLTIWGSQYDTVNIKGLVELIAKAGKDRVYLDLPPGDECQVRHFRPKSTAKTALYHSTIPRP